jgi:hypothetical protein
MKHLMPAGLLLGAVVAVAPVRAAPPENADPSLSPWYNSLRQPGTGALCCSIADCRPTEYRITRDHYEALVEGIWRDVPPDRVVKREDNPTGRAVVCWTPTAGVLCFIKGPEI